MNRVLSHFIDGRFSQEDKGETIAVFNPATGEPVASMACGTVEDIDRAVLGARKAVEDNVWRDMALTERSALLTEIGNRIKANAGELAALEAASSGGTIRRITGMDLPVCIDLCNEYAELVKSFPFIEYLPGKLIPEITHTTIVREPIGVCGLITPWNLPLTLLLVKLIPALAGGNTVVVKPSELTPCTTIRLAEILADLLPPGVFNVVLGTGLVVGEAIASHPGIDKVSFTGSTSVGKRIQVNAVSSLKRVTLELGGKSPAIVMTGADLDLVAHGALFGSMLNAGQMCESGTRLLVHESEHSVLLARLAELCSDLRLGDPLDPATAIGPVVSEAQGEKILNLIERARAQGARIVCGGKRATVPACPGGFFLTPTIITDVSNEMEIAREEVFGPVLCILRYNTLDEAVRIANDTYYGLAAGIWTSDVVAAQALATRLQAGSVWINDWHMLRSDAPFGGYKQSGYGRELGVAGLQEYLQTKVISTAFERQPQAKLLYGLLHDFSGI